MLSVRVDLFGVAHNYGVHKLLKRQVCGARGGNRTRDLRITSAIGLVFDEVQRRSTSIDIEVETLSCASAILGEVQRTCDNKCDRPDIRQGGTTQSFSCFPGLTSVWGQPRPRGDSRQPFRDLTETDLADFRQGASKWWKIIVRQCQIIHDFHSGWIQKTVDALTFWRAFGVARVAKSFARLSTSTTNSSHRAKNLEFGQVYEYKLAEPS